MLRRPLFLALLAFLTLGPSAARAGFDDPMRFSLQPADPACPHCLTILAQGQIMLDSADLLERFLAKLSPVGRVRVEFDSPGGFIQGAVQLGQTIRDWHLDTTVGRHAEPGSTALDHDSACYSACSYAFLGGIRRVVEPDVAFGVHQTYFAEPVNPGAAFLEPLFGTIARAVLSDYIDAMGASTDLLDLAYATRPEDMHVMTRAELHRYAVTTPEIRPGRWDLRGGRMSTRQAQSGGFEAGIVLSCDRHISGNVSLLYWRETPAGREAARWADYMNQFLNAQRWAVRIGADDRMLARFASVATSGFDGVREVDGRIEVTLSLQADSLAAAADAAEIWVFGDFPDLVTNSGYAIEGWFAVDRGAVSAAADRCRAASG